MFQKVRSYLGKTVIGKITHRVSYTSDIYIPRPFFSARNNNLSKTLLITCTSGFNQDFPIAASLMREGFARGWAEVCGPAKLIRDYEIFREIELFENPAVFMCEFDFDNISYSDARKLRDVDLFVWVGIHPRMSSKWERQVLTDYPSMERSLNAYAKILLSEPKFVWNAVGDAGQEWYQGWRDDGLNWETIYPGVDKKRYFPEHAPEKYGHIKMAYVGGYWPEKAQGFDMYLRPWEDIFVPFGYAKWPYKNYAGRINEQDERQLYTTAGLIPLVTSPAGWLIAEITERYLKAPACNAFCIADHNPALREIFSKEEMIQAESPEHFHELVKEYLSGEIDTQQWRDKAYKAVQERHLYSHRALQIKKALSN
jgi:hypothetical protein